MCLKKATHSTGKTWVWTYDNAGNILSKKEYAYTTGTLGSALTSKTYTYGNANWGDLLTKYNGVSITYDSIGNPLNDGTWTYTWQEGRKLASMSKSGITWTYTYDANGMRTRRTGGGSTYNYTYHGSQLTHMTYGSNVLHFYYDASGKPLSVIYNGATYYYVLNLQGDVVALLDSSGNQVVGYTYDAWGKLLATTGSKASSLGLHNPLRYRGYVYDWETGLYYLQSRYYNPEIGRFINADGYVSTGQGLSGNNMFAYCGNNPVNRADDGGECWHLLIGAAVGVATQYISDVVWNLASGKSFTEALSPTSSWADYTSAAIGGALAASGIGLVGSIAANATLGGVTYLVNCDIKGTTATKEDLVGSILIGGFAGAVGGKGADGSKLRGVYKTAKNVLETAVSPKKIAMYTAKIASCNATIIEGVSRTFVAGMASNYLNSKRKQWTLSPV